MYPYFVSLCAFAVSHVEPSCMKTRSQAVLDRVRDDILRGHYPPEFHLQEIPLSAELGVSRTPVRTALASLATEGLLDYVAKRGYSVRSFTLEEIEAAHEIRANLEGLACRLAAERGLSTESERELEAILALGDRILAHGALRDEDRGPWSAMNDQFHSRLLVCADNRLLSDIAQFPNVSRPTILGKNLDRLFIELLERSIVLARKLFEK